MSIIWITHDLGIVAGIAHRVLVMYGGYIIEAADVKELFANPSHPYTLGLIGSLPRVDGGEKERLYSIEGMPPVLYSKPDACPFAPDASTQLTIAGKKTQPWKNFKKITSWRAS